MIFRPYYYDDLGCAAYVFGCGTLGKGAVVDARADDIDIAAVILSDGFAGFAIGSVLLGIGTAMVYPTLLAAIGDVAAPAWRASSVGVYRLWRDLGYAVGAVVAGLTADSLGLKGAMWLVAGITFLSGVIVGVRMDETLRRRMA
jgi:MFS family permease